MPDGFLVLELDGPEYQLLLKAISALQRQYVTDRDIQERAWHFRCKLDLADVITQRS